MHVRALTLRFIPSLLLVAVSGGTISGCASPSGTQGAVGATGNDARSSTPGERAGSTPAFDPARLAPTPWTTAFAEKAVLVADHVRIEGPNGLLEHVVVRADDAYFERQVEHDGARLVQITRRLSDAVPEIRAQLDNWQIAGLREVTVVEHLAPRDVTVVATGTAVYRDPLGKEQRAETLRFTGTIEE
jgi:hypothetical protein